MLKQSNPLHFFKPIIAHLMALVWLINGLYCKVLNGVPRHQLIVGEILGVQHAATFTLLIGIAEIVMAIWIWSRWRSRLNASLQILVVLCMNILEFILVPHLLLWGRWNILFAILFVSLVYYQVFVLNKNKIS